MVNIIEIEGIEEMNLDEFNHYTIAGVLMNFLMELKNPICTFELYSLWIKALGQF